MGGFTFLSKSESVLSKNQARNFHDDVSRTTVKLVQSASIRVLGRSANGTPPEISCKPVSDLPHGEQTKKLQLDIVCHFEANQESIDKQFNGGHQSIFVLHVGLVGLLKAVLVQGKTSST